MNTKEPGFRGTQEISTGTTVRVVCFKPQIWPENQYDSDRAERFLIECYIGKMGNVVDIDDREMPYRVKFDMKVPMEEMRFFAEEVEAV